jgi:MinD superfamily P-loop ATPase
MARRPADFAVSNFYARVEADLCRGHATCVDRRQMEAVVMKEGVARINRARCLGCGLCVPYCPEDAIRLVKKERERVPPRDTYEMHEIIATKPRSALEKIGRMAKAMLGI